MKILVVSDNHGNVDTLKEILKRENYDKSFHLGDGGVSREWLSKNFDYIVCGNHDVWSPTEIFVELEGLKIMALHGHTRMISVFNREKVVKKILNDENVDLLLHGHTHIFSFGESNKKYWLCPGSTNLSRSPEGNGYVTFEIEKGEIKNINFKEI